MERDNRWARPSMTSVEWAMDATPAFFDHSRIRALMEKGMAEPNALILVAPVPMLHRVDEGDGTEATWFWRGQVLLVESDESRRRGVIVATRLASVAMHESGDIAEEVAADFAARVMDWMGRIGQLEVRHVS